VFLGGAVSGVGVRLDFFIPPYSFFFKKIFDCQNFFENVKVELRGKKKQERKKILL
jgi:hypothetical protein